MALNGIATEVENEIRNLTLTKRIRPAQFFLDFDNLRSGFVTESQFVRVLWKNLGIKLSDEQKRAVSNRYSPHRDGRIHYRSFCTVIEQPFDPNNLGGDPSQKIVKPVQFLGTERSVHTLSSDEEAAINDLLRNLASYYQYRGINLRTSCEDFDWHHIGVIQESQFYRSFLRPAEVTEDQVDLLVRKYRDPTRPGLLNYLNMHHDLQSIQQNNITDTRLDSATNFGDYLKPEPGADSTLQQILDRIRVSVFRNRVRTIEFFKDYDKLRSGVITENQFVCSLSLAIGKEAQLTRPEIQKVVEFYKMSDGRIRYKEFCDMMENAFNVPDLDKKPTQPAIRPPTGTLGRNLCGLSEPEEIAVRDIVNNLADQVQRRRIMMYQYFKDYDRSRAYSRIITQTQFGRMLHFLNLSVTPAQLKLLCKKFADEPTGDINYPAFVQAVDREFVNYTKDSPEQNTQSELGSPAIEEQLKSVDISGVDFDELMSRIRHVVLTNRRRVIEYFQDFDSLRSGIITKSQFRRGLSNLGFSSLGEHNLNDAQFEVLYHHYRSSRMPENVLWTQFMWDVESVFTQQNLEKAPTHQVPKHDIFLVPKSGTMDWQNASDDHKAMVGQIMSRLQQRTDQRRVLAKPVFQDFDRHNNGHITRPQFRQCLTILELNCTEAEMSALEVKYCNDTGFNYMSFLSDLQPQEPLEMMYIKRQEQIRAANQKGKLPEKKPGRDLESVLIKIKTRVVKERVRVLEWMKDYDKLRSGRMLKGNFRRALDLCKFGLEESEIAILEDHYQAYGQPDFVNYTLFNDDIEAVFTIKNLEKAPLQHVEQYKPADDCAENYLSKDTQDMLMGCLHRIADKVRKTRMQLIPLFEDYDRVHNGSVSTSQFRRVLNELNLANLVTNEQEWVALNQKFHIDIGGKDDFNYNAFCDNIYELADLNTRMP